MRFHLTFNVETFVKRWNEFATKFLNYWTGVTQLRRDVLRIHYRVYAKGGRLVDSMVKMRVKERLICNNTTNVGGTITTIINVANYRRCHSGAHTPDLRIKGAVYVRCYPLPLSSSILSAYAPPIILFEQIFIVAWVFVSLRCIII